MAIDGMQYFDKVTKAGEVPAPPDIKPPKSNGDAPMPAEGGVGGGGGGEIDNRDGGGEGVGDGSSVRSDNYVGEGARRENDSGGGKGDASTQSVTGDGSSADSGMGQEGGEKATPSLDKGGRETKAADGKQETVDGSTAKEGGGQTAKNSDEVAQNPTATDGKQGTVDTSATKEGRDQAVGNPNEVAQNRTEADGKQENIEGAPAKERLDNAGMKLDPAATKEGMDTALGNPKGSAQNDTAAEHKQENVDSLTGKEGADKDKSVSAAEDSGSPVANVGMKGNVRPMDSHGTERNIPGVKEVIFSDGPGTSTPDRTSGRKGERDVGREAEGGQRANPSSERRGEAIQPNETNPERAGNRTAERTPIGRDSNPARGVSHAPEYKSAPKADDSTSLASNVGAKGNVRPMDSHASEHNIPGGKEVIFSDGPGTSARDGSKSGTMNKDVGEKSTDIKPNTPDHKSDTPKADSATPLQERGETTLNTKNKSESAPASDAKPDASKPTGEKLPDSGRLYSHPKDNFGEGDRSTSMQGNDKPGTEKEQNNGKLYSDPRDHSEPKSDASKPNSENVPNSDSQRNLVHEPSTSRQPWHGNFLGPGNNGLEKPPVDQLDAGAKSHDITYHKLGANGLEDALFNIDRRIIAADAKLTLDAVKSIFVNREYDVTSKDFTGPQSIEGRINAIGTAAVFGTITFLKIEVYGAATIMSSVSTMLPFFSANLSFGGAKQ